MKCLIVNADDFGYSPGVNKGIIEAISRGIVTSTSLMVDAVAADEASSLAKFPEISVGLHFVLNDLENVQDELERQIEKFVTIVGYRPDHIDTHKCHPTDPGVKSALAEYSRLNKIPIRGFGVAKFIDSFFGNHGDGDLSVEGLKRAIDQVQNGYNEIMCHVGYADEYIIANSSYNVMRETELKAICDPSVRQYIKSKEIQLCDWKQPTL